LTSENKDAFDTFGFLDLFLGRLPLTIVAQIAQESLLGPPISHADGSYTVRGRLFLNVMVKNWSAPFAWLTLTRAKLNSSAL
jgi:hypothetical protein